jgi:hypothetical protein
VIHDESAARLEVAKEKTEGFLVLRSCAPQAGSPAENYCVVRAGEMKLVKGLLKEAWG